MVRVLWRLHGESDKSIKCRDCGEEFVFSAGEQAFYKERGFQHEPTRCRRCETRRSAKAPAPPREA